MLMVGMCCDNVGADSYFSCAANDIHASVLTKVTSELETRAYIEKSSTELLESTVAAKQVVRTVLGSSRINHVIIISLLLISIYLLSLYFSTSFLLKSACLNQYGQRTLEYIHHKDGKKA
jgi:hypothetical protein